MAASKQFKVSRYSIYEWDRKVARAERGEGPSPVDGPDPIKLAEQRDREILAEWRRHPGLGPSQIRNQLRRHHGIHVGVGTVRSLMIEHGYRPPNIKRREHDAEIEPIRPNYRWHLDYFFRYISKARVGTLILLDAFSRFIVGFAVDDAERTNLVIETLEQAIARYGKPESILNDKGSAFWSRRGLGRLTAWLTEYDILQEIAKEKEWNGKLESFNGKIQDELFNSEEKFASVSAYEAALQHHVHFYNHGRTHQGLGGVLVPADRFYGRVDEALALLQEDKGEAGELHRLQVRDRTLEPLKVVLKGDKTELWVLGRRLIELTLG